MNLGCTTEAGSNAPVTLTKSETEPWWSVDIGYEADIDLVKVHHRKDGTESSISNYTVRVGNFQNPKNNPACPGFHSSSQNVTCKLRGRYVGIVLHRTDALSLCEVEAFTAINPTWKRIPVTKATQSSTGVSGDVGPEKASDGLYNCDKEGFTTHT